ncbi:MAG: hypothetical protein V4697_02405 [Patescibacteria group bacterium]
MIEITTGIVFLLSSMYGAGNTAAAVQATPAIAPTNEVESVQTIDRKDIEIYLRKHFASTPILVEVAWCESTFTQYDKEGNVIRGRVNNADVGVMQINEKYHLEAAERLGLDIHTVEGNVAYAKYLYDTYGTSPWNASKPCWGDKVVAIK